MVSITPQVLDSLWNDLAADGDLDQDHMRKFYGLFSDKIFSCLPALTPESVKKMVTPSGRFVFRVQNIKVSSKTDPYDYNYVLFSGNTCSCIKTQAASPRDGIHWCKHLIAAKISAAIESYETTELTEEDYKSIFKSIIYNK